MWLMPFNEVLIIALLALIIDRIWGEFLNTWHPVVLIGKLISGYEKLAYAPSMVSGLGLVIWTLSLSLGGLLIALWALSFLPHWLYLLTAGLFASTLLAHRMLHDLVLAVAQSPSPNEAIAHLVSRDTAHLSSSDCYKAGIETYSENLSDGVIAPLFYLLLFGLPGMLLYKAINTLDSMVGYRTDRFERFGKVAARLDDVLNWIPARITAALILILSGQGKFWQFYAQGKGHASPNAGHPITAMALACQIQLGGPTAYFGQLQPKPYFGQTQYQRPLTPADIIHALRLRHRVDIFLLSMVILGLFLGEGFA